MTLATTVATSQTITILQQQEPVVCRPTEQLT